MVARVCEPFFMVTVSGRIDGNSDLDFLVRFRVQKKLTVFEHVHLVVDLRNLCCSSDVDLGSFFSAWALFVLTRCDRITVVRPSDERTRELVAGVVRAMSERGGEEEGSLPVVASCDDLDDLLSS